MVLVLRGIVSVGETQNSKWQRLRVVLRQHGNSDIKTKDKVVWDFQGNCTYGSNAMMASSNLIHTNYSWQKMN